jgi:hypothetical protein
VPSIDELDLTGLVEALEGNIRFKFVASFVFKVLNERNCFAVWPNTKMYEIYFMDEDVPRYATPATFMLEFWNRVMVKQVKPLLKERWSRYHEYAQSLTVNSSRGFNAYVTNEVAMINSFMRSEFYTAMKSAIMGHLKTVPRNERFQTRVNMGVEVPETRSIMYVAQAKCSLNNCERSQSLYGVCEFHREMWLNSQPKPETV